MSDKLKLAILDMYEGHPNLGLDCIKSIVERYLPDIEYDVFDVRLKNEVPDLSYDIFISSGGPGNPLEGNGVWEVRFFDLVDQLWQYNKKSEAPQKKYAFFICHSFQMICHHFKLGDITPRRSTSFGVFPVHKTRHGKKDRIFNKLPDPFFAVDSRDWQVVQPNLKVFEKHGARIIALERIKSKIEYERAIMAVRFSDEIVGTQFHPEADAEGMKTYLLKKETKEKIEKNFSKKKYRKMLDLLDHPDKIATTQEAILPAFMENAILKLTTTTTEKTINQ